MLLIGWVFSFLTLFPNSWGFEECHPPPPIFREFNPYLDEVPKACLQHILAYDIGSTSTKVKVARKNPYSLDQKKSVEVMALSSDQRQGIRVKIPFRDYAKLEKELNFFETFIVDQKGFYLDRQVPDEFWNQEIFKDCPEVKMPTDNSFQSYVIYGFKCIRTITGKVLPENLYEIDIRAIATSGFRQAKKRSFVNYITPKGFGPFKNPFGIITYVVDKTFYKRSNIGQLLTQIREKTQTKFSIVDQSFEAIVGYAGGKAQSTSDIKEKLIFDGGGGSMQFTILKDDDEEKGVNRALFTFGSRTILNFVEGLPNQKPENCEEGNSKDCTGYNSLNCGENVRTTILKVKEWLMEDKEEFNKLKEMVHRARGVVGIGGVHYFSGRMLAGKFGEEYSIKDLERVLGLNQNQKSEWLCDKSKNELIEYVNLGRSKCEERYQAPHFETDIPNLAMVYAIMSTLGIEKIELPKTEVNLTDGLIQLPDFVMEQRKINSKKRQKLCAHYLSKVFDVNQGPLYKRIRLAHSKINNESDRENFVEILKICKDSDSKKVQETVLKELELTCNPLL